ncbi:unnamed protein product [Amoebophrya sp. A120]|nr:unnamed protein product [Amoebophrya sp. A120]|eukprot:GSA120T00007491001.1
MSTSSTDEAASGGPRCAGGSCPYSASNLKSSWLASMFCPHIKAQSQQVAGSSSSSSNPSLPSPRNLVQAQEIIQPNKHEQDITNLNPKTMAESRGSRLNKALLSGSCPMMRGSGEKAASHGDAAVAEDKTFEQMKSLEEQQLKQIQSAGINPRNMMPIMANQSLPSDKVAFDKSREVSSIPKTGESTGTTWVYPSPQQFYNALRRRGKVDEQDELEKGNTMDSIVFAHNVTNEQTWTEILDWEHKLHYDRCKDPTLLSFVGKSEELSLGGHFSNYFRARGAPFDRHDWLVDRCGLEQVRYIIDYYDDPHANDQHGLDISLVTRPAPDSVQNVWDILRKPYYDYLERSKASSSGGVGEAGMEPSQK